MTARKILLWGLPVLVCGFIFANIYIENSYQSGRQAGWITYLENAKNRSTMISSSCYGKGNIFVDGQGGIWIIGAGTCDTYHDIYHFDGEIWTNMGSAKNIQLALDKQGQIWRLTEQDIDRQSHTSTLEIAVFKEGNWVTYSTVSSKNLHKDIISINTFAIDARGSVWVGYHWQSDGGMKGPGVSVFDGLNWISYTRYNSGLTGDGRVTVIAFDQQDQAWIATEPGGVNVFDGQKWIYYVVEPNDLRTKFNINVIAFDDGGDAWLGNENGEVIVYDGEQWAIYAPGKCMNFPCYQDIAFDNHGTAWVASSKAVSTFDGETWTFLTPENSGLAGNAINAVAVDGEGRIWIGTNHGISVHTSGEIVYVPAGLVNLRAFLTKGAYWFVPFILISLWLAALLKMLPGVGLGIGLGLASSIFFIHFGGFPFSRLQSIFTFPSPVVVASLGGVAGGLVGGMLDRWRGKKRISIILAFVGASAGCILLFVFLYLVAVSGGF